MTETILKIEDLTVSFDGFKAINNLNLSLEKGELRVIIGPNGAGKTTLQDVITGKVQPTTGQVYFKGRKITGLAEHEVARLGIGRKFQTPRVYLNLTVRQNLDLACNRNKNLFSTLFKTIPSTEKRHVVGLLETIGLTAKADLSASLLSHGEKQRLEIGMLVAQSPDLLLVDEPVAGLTDEETENIGALLLALAESHSIIVIEHDMEFVRQIARQVTVLHQGSVLFEGTMDEVQSNPNVIEVYLGKSPELTPEQMNILQVIALFIDSDGLFEIDDKRQIISEVAAKFAGGQDPTLVEETLQLYLSEEIEWDYAIAQLQNSPEKEQVLALSQDILTSRGIDPSECEIYQTLMEQLMKEDLDGVSEL
ncbi:urea ABC transporter ATP-binding protein UrtD [Spirulina subsalsa]|uniref:urea ABC transporter ATP-binding protein UrtD n=1 Tax=Spirulina subsalsa TaxID=54311 RepID=UPI0002DDCE11|nr:urea ABC transporter ATP-binding protein UrtD [Spirulina subsalsa]